MPHAQAEDTRVDWEGALVQRARTGDRRAFERLYREHAGRVYGLCLRMTRDAQLAEDCTQDTFINAWRALGKFETRSSLSTWLHRIAVNVSLAKRRKSGRVESLPEDEEEGQACEWTLETPVEVQEIESAIGELPEGREMCSCCTPCTATRTSRPRRCSASPRAPARRSCIARASCCVSGSAWR